MQMFGSKKKTLTVGYNMSLIFEVDPHGENFFARYPAAANRSFPSTKEIDLLPPGSPMLSNPWVGASSVPAVTQSNGFVPMPEVGPDESEHLRMYLKIVRNPRNSAFDTLPNGQTIGGFANRHAINRYARTIESKREQTRASRQQNRKRDASSS